MGCLEVTLVMCLLWAASLPSAAALCCSHSSALGAVDVPPHLPQSTIPSPPCPVNS